MHPAIKLVLVLSFLIFVYSIIPREQYLWLNPLICTKLANDMIPETFYKVKIGMDKDSVKKFTGNPLKTDYWVENSDTLFSDKYSIEEGNGWAWIEYATYYYTDGEIVNIANREIRND